MFETPAWVPLPEVLAPHVAAGGTYLAEHRETGERVVLREARPYSGLDGSADDAVARLHREYRMLRRLDGLDCVPRVYKMLTVWEHQFLIEEYIEGTTLLQEVISRHPLTMLAATPQEVADYADWVAGVSGGLAKAVTALHERGVRFGDLHPSNVIVRPDGSVTLIDFEYADDLTSDRVPQAGAAGFTTQGLTGSEADRYGLWAIWLAMLAPLTEMVRHDPRKADALETWGRRRLGLGPEAGPARPLGSGSGIGRPSAERDEAAELFGAETPDWPAIRELLVSGIHAGATPERRDRLWPPPAREPVRPAAERR